VLALLVEVELVSATCGGGGGGCCRLASSSSSTLDNSVELSLLLVEVEALVALDALVASEALVDVLSLAERPDRKLMFNSWKYAGGIGAAWLSRVDALLLALLVELLLLVEADVC